MSIKFTEYSLEMCSNELWFSKVNDSTFSFSESLDYYDLAQVIKLKLKVPHDSVTVEAGYDNRYGVLYSETEGAYFYYDKSPESVLFSGWKRVKVLDPNRKYSLDCFGFGKGFVNNNAPKIDKEIVKKWAVKQPWIEPHHRVSVFCTEMQLKITIHSDGKRKAYYLVFDRRIGEC